MDHLVWSAGCLRSHIQSILDIWYVLWSRDAIEVIHKVREIIVDPIRSEFGSALEAVAEPFVLPKTQRHLCEVRLQTIVTLGTLDDIEW